MKKRSIALVLALLLGLSHIKSASAATLPAYGNLLLGEEGKSHSLYLHPTAESPVVAVSPSGSRLLCVAEYVSPDDGKNWYQVELSGAYKSYAWIAAEYLTFEPNAEQEPALTEGMASGDKIAEAGEETMLHEAQEEDVPESVGIEREQVEKLVAEEKVPMYVRDKGEFVYNPETTMIRITGDGVFLRTQPNVKANAVAKVYKEMWGAIDYLGEWTHPKGDKWIVGLYDDWSKYPEAKAEKDKKVVWIPAKFAVPVTNEEYAQWRSGINLDKAKALAQSQKEKKTASRKKQPSKNQASASKQNKKNAQNAPRKVMIWQCVRCGERHIRGLVPGFDALLDIASLGTNAGGPPHTQCRFGGYHVWQRIK